MSFHEKCDIVTDEIKSVLQRVKAEEVDILINEILRADKVFLVAVGRVFLSLQGFGKRLAHLGVNVQIVGSVTEKAITEKDLLIVASGSGESILPRAVAEKAKKFNARLGIITAAPVSTIKGMADFAVHLPCPTKTATPGMVNSVQPMSTLFDQSLHIFGDAVSMLIQERKGLRNEDMWRNHANLE